MEKGESRFLRAFSRALLRFDKIPGKLLSDV
jgi:hypothetical protein